MNRSALLTTAWMDDAACAERADLPWLADDVGLAASTVLAGICSGCPVLAHCETYARAGGIVGGFWAGHDRGPALVPVQDVLFGQAG